MDLPEDFSLLKLQFGHDCRNTGCNLRGCELCRNNPQRMCQTHFREKYVDNANRVLLAWCQAPILARVVDAHTLDEYVGDRRRLDGVQLQLFLLEGVAYDQKEKEVGADNLTDEDYEAMVLLDNTSSSKPEPLLVPGKGCPGVHSADHRLIVPLQAEGTPIFVRTSRSSQSAQGGRTRPFRLMARGVWPDGTPVPYILPDVSEPFVVTTRRTQGAEKALVPKWDDSVSKLPGVGKETFTKLKDLRASGLATPLDNYRILTVGQLHDLMDRADSALLQDLGRTLTLKHDKVLELQDNVRAMAHKDSRKRVWGSPRFPSERLLFPCNQASVDFESRHIEVMRDTDDGVEIIDTADLSAEDQISVNEMREVAFSDWWTPHHPGWGIFNVDELNIAPGVNGGVQPLGLETLSLRQEMDRECKQRRFQEPDYEHAFPDPVEFERPQSLRPADGYLGISIDQGVKAEPSFEDYAHVHASVSAPDHVMPGRSVFHIDSVPQDEPVPGFDHVDVGRARETDANGPDINSAPSAGALLEAPVGLAYINAGPNFERIGPIRFKRTVSGNRYKQLPAEQAQQPAANVHNGGYGPILEGVEVPRPHMPPPLQSPLQGLPQQHSFGVFKGAALPPKPSRELRSQSSLDKVAFWQQTRPLSSSNLGERFSQNLLQSFLEDVQPSAEFPDFDAAFGYDPDLEP